MKRKYINEQQLKHIISNILAEELQRGELDEGRFGDFMRNMWDGIKGAGRGFRQQYQQSRQMNDARNFTKMVNRLRSMGYFSSPQAIQALTTLTNDLSVASGQMNGGQNYNGYGYGSGAAAGDSSDFGYGGAAAAAGGAADFGYGNEFGGEYDNYGGSEAVADSGLGYAAGGAADAAFDGNNVMMPQDNTPQDYSPQQYKQGNLFSDEEMAQQTVQPTQQPKQWTQGQFQFNTPQGKQLELPFTYDDDDDTQKQQQTDPRYNVQTNIGNPYVIDGVSESIARRRINGLVREAIQSILR